MLYISNQRDLFIHLYILRLFLPISPYFFFRRFELDYVSA